MAQQADTAKMDAAAIDAANELKNMSLADEADLDQVAAWFKSWYLKAGYKRLARLVMEYAE